MSLVDDLGLEDRACVSIVGAGGKSTILLRLADELTGSPRRVVVTATTKLAPDQLGEPVLWSADPAAVDAALSPGVPLFVATRSEPHKVIGITPGEVDRIHHDSGVDVLLVEADGARHRLVKAPADHEPAIPSVSTTVIVVVGADAVGRPISEVAHRPERVAALAQIGADDPLTVDAVARVMLAERGGLKGIPEAARVVVAVTTPGPAADDAASRLAATIEEHARIDRVLVVDRSA